MHQTLSNIKFEKANQKDWDSILKLLEETNLTFWFTGNENYSQFYIVKVRDPNNKNMICCFAIEYENKTGILKSFAVSKDLQGTGIGKFIVNNKIKDISKGLGIFQLYAASQEAPGFWQKTIFKEIKFSEIKDSFFLEYLKKSCFKIKSGNYYEMTRYFLLYLGPD